MKKLLYISVLLAYIITSATSCVQDEEDIFDKPSAERTNTAIAEYKKILQSAPDGWIMEYYAGKSTAINGGYNLLCSFNENGEVTVASELNPGVEHTSLYEIQSEQSVMLSFCSYNPLIHYFSQPNNGPNSLFGDFEFVFFEVSETKIIMKGKKRGNTIVMTRYDKAETWQEYLTEVNKTIEYVVEYSNFKIDVNGNEIGKTSVNINRSYAFSFNDGSSYSKNAIYTTTGIKFYEPIMIGNHEVQYFDWNNESLSFICTDNTGATIVMTPYVDPSYIFYRDFIGTYSMEYSIPDGSLKTVTATIEVIEEDKTLLLKGFTPYELVLQYNKASGTISLLSQIVGTKDDYNITVCSFDHKAGYLTRTTTIGMNSIRDTEFDGIKFGFKDNGAWGTYVVRSYIIWLYTSAGVSGGEYTAIVPSRYIEPVMTKID